MMGRNDRLLRLLGMARRDLEDAAVEIRALPPEEETGDEHMADDRPRELDEIARRVEALEKRVDVIEARSS